MTVSGDRDMYGLRRCEIRRRSLLERATPTAARRRTLEALRADNCDDPHERIGAVARPITN
jgi:hypothetical protein